MHILFVTRGCRSQAYPLLGIFETDQAKALCSLGLKISYLAIDLRSIRRRRKLGYHFYNKDGFDVFELSLPIGAVPIKLFTFIGRLCALFLYRKVVKKNGVPDIIHSHFANIGTIASVLKRKYNVPLVHTEHSSEIIYNKIDSIKKRLYGKVYTDADAVIAVSPALQKALRDTFKVDALMIFNIIDFNTFTNIRNINGNNTFTFVSVGGLIYRKGFDLLITAFAELSKDINANLVIVGQGPLLPSLQDLSRKLNVADKIIFTGNLDRESIAAIMSKSQAFVLASRGETFGVVYAEAMAAGLPVIATKCGGPESFVNSGNGILAPTDNIQGLVKAMKYIYNNIGQYDSMKLRNQAYLMFSYQSIGQKIINLYKTIINYNMTK